LAGEVDQTEAARQDDVHHGEDEYVNVVRTGKEKRENTQTDGNDTCEGRNHPS
jgi:hypothetical protein